RSQAMASRASRPPRRAPWCPPAPKSLSAANADCSKPASSAQSTIKLGMNWPDLISAVASIGSAGSFDAPVSGVEYDSRRVRPGSVFVAMKGGSTDGNRFVDKAIAAGALGIITDSAQTFDHLTGYQPDVLLPHVEHGRRALARASAAFFGHPERSLSAIGITGTNG